MIKSLLLLFICAAITPRAFAAIGAGTVWEIRGDATAGNVNGGGFDATGSGAGTDFSKQTTAQFAFSDLATTTGTTTCVVTSASHNFVSTDNRNIIHIASGGTFTAGWYEIISTSANAATLDRACASGASTSAGVWKEGGAISLGAASDVTWGAVPVGGNTVWIRNSTLSLGSSITFTNMTATTGLSILGYNTARGDNPTGANRPAISAAASQFTVGTGNTLKNVILNGTGAIVLSAGAQGTIYNTKIINSSTTTGRAAVAMTTNGSIINCEIVCYNGNAINTTNGGINVIANYIHDSNIGITSTATTIGHVILNNIFDSMTTTGVALSGALSGPTVIAGNTFYGSESKTGTGVSIGTGPTGGVRIFNNIIYGFATGINSTDTLTNIFDGFNDYNNNTADTSGWTKGVSDISTNPGFANLAQLTGATATSSGTTLTDSGQNFNTVTDNRDFVNVTATTGGTVGQYLITAHTTTTLTTDNSLGSGTAVHYQVTTGRNFAVGVAMKFKGIPGAFPANLTTGYMDIGAAQRHEYGRKAR